MHMILLISTVCPPLIILHCEQYLYGSPLSHALPHIIIDLCKTAHRDFSHLLPNSDFTATILSNALLTDLVHTSATKSGLGKYSVRGAL